MGFAKFGSGSGGVGGILRGWRYCRRQPCPAQKLGLHTSYANPHNSIHLWRTGRLSRKSFPSWLKSPTHVIPKFDNSKSRDTIFASWILRTKFYLAFNTLFYGAGWLRMHAARCSISSSRSAKPDRQGSCNRNSQGHGSGWASRPRRRRIAPD